METCCDFCAYNEYDEDDEEVNASLLNSLCFLPLLRFYVQHSRNAAGHGWERGNMLNNNQLMSLCMCKRGQ